MIDGDVRRDIGTIHIQPGMIIEFEYHNHHGAYYAKRRVEVIRFEFGATEWHPEQQMFLHGICTWKQHPRSFATKDMYSVRVVG